MLGNPIQSGQVNALIATNPAVKWQLRGPALWRVHHGLQEVLGGRVEPLVAVVDEVLGQAGGRLWVGYERAGDP
ncbi:hypothetical protein TPA0905_11020 [Streptomyces olivaceus]|nr:hypothetical protein TPA0905_11020 [Streptomyces olivaceus]